MGLAEPKREIQGREFPDGTPFDLNARGNENQGHLYMYIYQWDICFVSNHLIG